MENQNQTVQSEQPNKDIVVNYDQNLETKEVIFKVRASSSKDTDDDGNVKLDEKGEEIVLKKAAREMKLAFRVPSIQGIVSILEKGGKGLEFLLEVVQEVVQDRAESLFRDNDGITAENFPFEELDWDTIAALPKEVRRESQALSKEDWESFTKEYNSFMVSLGIPKEQVSRQSAVFKQKLRPVATRKDILPQFALLLNIFAQKYPSAENHSGVIEYLVKANKKLMETKEKDPADVFGLGALESLAKQ